MTIYAGPSQEPKVLSHLKTATVTLMTWNLSPKKFRKLYSIYDNKIGTGSESAEGLKILKEQVERAGYQIVVARGDFKE